MNYANRKSAVEDCVRKRHSLGSRAMKLGAPEVYEFGVEALSFLDHGRRDINPDVAAILRQGEDVVNRPTVAEPYLQNLALPLKPQCGEDLRAGAPVGLVEPDRHRKAGFPLGIPQLARLLSAA